MSTLSGRVRDGSVGAGEGAGEVSERVRGAVPGGGGGEGKNAAGDKAVGNVDQRRAPLLLLAVADLGSGEEDIPATERLVSAGCAIQNMLLMATALGFGSALTSGKAMASAPLRGLFALREQEQALCFVSIGTIAGAKRGRTRPDVERYVGVLELDP